ncbi:MAG: hypothetical protein B6241_00440 [Spirochaetaceae bacterium 4572_59]|nr:MAG: hypothetical protein B6241_00440 [Spirochaetaceae bacterium 4572_59]
MIVLKKTGLFLILSILLITSAVAEEDISFTVNFAPSDFSLNPQYGFTTSEAQIFTALYEGLVTYHPATLLPEPGLAESWEISEDGRIYTFHLRDNLKWSNGDALTAEQIKMSWLKLLSPSVSADYASLLDDIPGAHAYRTGQGKAEAVAIEAVDDRTFIVHLDRKLPYFLQILCHYSFVPLHPSLLNLENWWTSENIPTNGPFAYTGETKKNRIILRKNKEYWDRDSVKFTSLNLQFSKYPEELMDQFRLYEVDWIVSGWNGVSPDPQKLEINPLFATSYYYFNNNQVPWDNPKVRRGLSLLLPWDKIRAQEFLPTSRLIPSIPGYPKIKGIEAASAEQGLTLLKEAGYPEGRGLPEIRLRVPYADSEALKLIKETWENYLDTKVILEEVPFPDYFQSLKEDDYALGQITWIGDYADPMTFLQMWEEGSSLNDAGFYSEEYNRLLNEAVDENRLEKMGEAEKLLLESAQVLPMGHSPALNLLDLRFLSGWYHNVLDIHPFKYMGFLNEFVIPGTI